MDSKYGSPLFVSSQLLEKKPLIENDQNVTVEFNGSTVRAWSDPRSGYVWFDPPKPVDLSNYYAFQYGKDNGEYYSFEADHNPSRIKGMLNWFFNLVAPFRTDLKQLRIHELGCAYGGLVAELNHRGHDATGSGINPHAVREGRTRIPGARITPETNIEALRNLTAPVDVILASHVLEHDPDFHEVMGLIRERLKPDGLLVAGVPNSMYIRSLLEGFKSNPWVAYPDHLHMLSPGYIPILCDEVGLEPLHITTRTMEESPWFARHFGETYYDVRTRAVWNQIISFGEIGWELAMVLTPKGGALASARADEIVTERTRLSFHREKECKLRALLAKPDSFLSPVEAADELRGAQTMTRQLGNEKEQLSAELARVYGSRSWKVTQLPRWLFQLVRQVARKFGSLRERI